MCRGSHAPDKILISFSRDDKVIHHIIQSLPKDIRRFYLSVSPSIALNQNLSLSLSKIIVWTVLENTIKIDKILYQNTYSRSLASRPWSKSPLEFLRESLKKSQSLFPFCPLLYRYVVDFGLYFQFGVKKDCYLWVITYHMHISYAKNLSIYVCIC